MNSHDGNGRHHAAIRRSRIQLAVFIGLVVTACIDGEAPTAPAPGNANFAVVPVACNVADLIAALEAANTAPDETTIELDGTCKYELTSRYADENGLPIIDSDVIINGNGATIERNSAETFRIFYIGLFGDVTLNDLRIEGGDVFERGGGIRNLGFLVLRNSMVLGNSAMNNGGGIHNIGDVVIINSTLAGNGSSEFGGAIFNNGILSVGNSTIAFNDADQGAGIFNAGHLLTTYSTFAGNVASDQGGGIYNPGLFPTSIDNSIIALNVAPAGIDVGGDHTSVSNVIGGDPGLEVDMDGRPVLGNNGGSTLTIALVPGSPAIDQGDDDACIALLVSGTDQRGFDRLQAAGAKCDIGAFELGASDDTPPVITPIVTGTLGQNGWYTSDVTVSWTIVDDDSDITSMTGCAATTITADTDDITLTCTASSAGGPASNSVTIKRDATPPVLDPSVQPDPVPLHGNATATADAGDNLSGLASQQCDDVVTSSTGSKSLTCTATDNAGNRASASITYTVQYDFSGFTDPVSNDGVNIVKAGRTIPLIWRLLDAGGTPVSTLANVSASVTPVACSVDDSPTTLPEEDAAGKSGLQNLGDGWYQYNWKTPKSYAGKCLLLELDMGEGIVRTAEFHFTH